MESLIGRILVITPFESKAFSNVSQRYISVRFDHNKELESTGQITLNQLEILQGIGFNSDEYINVVAPDKFNAKDILITEIMALEREINYPYLYQLDRTKYNLLDELGLAPEFTRVLRVVA